MQLAAVNMALVGSMFALDAMNEQDIKPAAAKLFSLVHFAFGAGLLYRATRK